MTISCNMAPQARHTIVFVLLAATGPVVAQTVVWTEQFENGCSAGCYASGYTGPNGSWTVTNTGTNGACANRWFVSCRENGNAEGACGSGCGNNETLHVANDIGCTSPNGCIFCPSGDCGAAYDASCPSSLCSFCCSCNSAQTSKRAESPVIDLSGYSGITLSVKYMEGGQNTKDNATVWYYNGSTWGQLADPAKTATGCGGQGIWTAFSAALPASANNNPGVRIGFGWVNNNDGSGADPSFAVDDVQVTATIVMPIELLSFEASASDAGVQTTWSTASESDNAFFTVERSSDAVQFHAVGRVPGAGNSMAVLHYAWFDAQPLPGVAYYRLRQTDINGTSTVSGVRAVRMPGPVLTVRTDGTSLLLGSAEAGEWGLFDVLGRLMDTGFIAAGSEVRMNGKAGEAMYLLRLIHADRPYTYRLLSGAGTVLMQPVR
ncbi:MAG: hypothetical protein KDB93_07460 [Flavobacteriales bacterium]|nr:hypothetical protein [Flavobacteriales bacterium]